MPDFKRPGRSMRVNVVFDQIDHNRIFIDIGEQCPGGCLYCYSGAGTNMVARGDWLQPESVPSYIESRPSSHFIPGIYGTAISIGCNTDPLAPRCRLTTISLLEKLLRYGNPIQLASKYYELDLSAYKRLEQAQSYPGQLTLNVTISTLTRAAELERNVPVPEERIRALAWMQSSTTLNPTLLVKPAIPGVTDQEKELLLGKLQEHRIKYCVVGMLYADVRITERLIAAGVGFVPEMLSRGSHPYHFPNQERPVLPHVTAQTDLDELAAFLSRSACTTVFKTSMCAVAHRLGIPDPMRNWKRYPGLCIKCQDCEGLVHSQVPQELRARYQS